MNNVWSKSLLIFALALVPALICDAGWASRILGTVVDTEGSPIPFVRITISSPENATRTTSVFSTEDGSFSSPDLKFASESATLEAFRIGWVESNRSTEKKGKDSKVQFVMKAIKNVATQVPASAWIPGTPGERDYHTAIHECSNCHQLGAERVRRWSSGLQGIGTEQRTMAWEAMVQYMRSQAFAMGPVGNTQFRWGLSAQHPDYLAALVPETSFLVPRDMKLVVPLLGSKFPTNFDEYFDYNDIERLGEYGVTGETVIEEFALPSFGWTREVAVAPGADKVWFGELDGDRLGALDPKNGSIEWYEVPGEGPQGPHTINADSEGNLWIALEESYGLARFNTGSKEWRVYPPPPDVKFAITHDTAFNSKRQVEPDAEGRVWITLVGINELWSIHVETGEIERYPMPIPEDEQPFHVFLYGAAMEPNGKRVWWTQLHGYLGSFNIETKKVETVVPFPQGAAPRRMAIQDDGTLWVPLFGEGQLLKFDTARGKEVARYDLPDRAGASYSVTMDSRRNVVWVGTSNSDRIYRFDIAKESWKHYPLPRKEAYIRMIEVDPDTGDLWTSYSNLPVGKRDPKVFGSEAANNMIVRLHPGD